MSLLLTSILLAQEAVEKAPVPALAEQAAPTKRATLSALLATRESLRAGMEEQRKKLRSEITETGKQDVQAEIERLEKRRLEVERDFNALVTGRQSLVDLTSDPVAQTPMKLQDEIGQLLIPVFSDLRDVTRRPQELQSLRQELALLLSQKTQAERALDDVEVLLGELKAEPEKDASLTKELLATRERWQVRRDDVLNRIAVIENELKEVEKDAGSFWSELGRQVTNFIFVRGANIALALLAFLVVLFGLRGAYYYVLKLVPVKKYEKLSFSSRLLDVVHKGVSVVLAVAAALLVLYARGDWLLGGLALFAVGAMVMTAKSGISRHMEDLQMMLNLGQVREGERIYIDGVPWRVGAIHMFTQLTNIVIGGSGLRLPLDILSTFTSRPSGLDEPWFPCSKRSYVIIDGSLFAQVTDITPDRVELVHGGGLKRWMPIGEFMKADVSCLSGGFARSMTLGLDYKHQAQALKEIPELLKADVRKALLETMREEELVNVIVEFEQAADSSLNFIIVGVFTGSQAANYPNLTRVLQRAALDSATRHGWNIPFPQMVLRKAEK
ncbi:hypothetical protein [Prosthecobacter fusiformis]|uniref:hypothetical protein n=1 Tax=Prosthecobacter fusiformis TaxID=48464 RepID=UPI00106110CE|nr:hypothetical protein [Prosthecobacter fusiformis]